MSKREREPLSSTSSTEKSPNPKNIKMAENEQNGGRAGSEDDIPTLSMIYNILMEVQKNTQKVMEENVYLKNQFKELKEENDIAQSEIVNLKARIGELEDMQDEMQQYQRKYNLEICGIPESEDENLKDVIEAIATEVDVEIDSTDIDIVHRLPSKFRPRPIIVKFSAYDDKKELYESRWKLRRYKGSNEILNGATKVYINENLTTERKRLFAEARKRAKQYNWAGVTTKDGKIFVRKEKGEKAIKITKQSDLEDLYG